MAAKKNLKLWTRGRCGEEFGMAPSSYPHCHSTCIPFEECSDRGAASDASCLNIDINALA